MQNTKIAPPSPPSASEARPVVRVASYRCGCMKAETTTGYVAEVSFCAEGARLQAGIRRAGLVRGTLSFDDPGLKAAFEEVERREEELREHREGSGVEKRTIRRHDIALAPRAPAR